MANATSTFLTITNSTIQESGADLASFATNGSDWSTNTTAMLNRFKTWVVRAWKQIQVDNYDWEFMEEQGLCNIDPGVMFYTDGASVSSLIALASTTFDIYDQDGSVAISNVTAGKFTDLTGTSTVTSPFGYFNLAGITSSAPISFALKPGAEYFNYPSTVQPIILFSHSADPTDLTVTVAPNVDQVLTCVIGGGGSGIYAGTYTNAITWVSLTPGSVCTFSTNNATVAAFFNAADGATFSFVSGVTTYVAGQGDIGPATQVSSTPRKAYIHSWKSFDFSEETQSGDFQEAIQEIDPSSFRIIDFYKGAPSGEVPLPYVPWNVFRSQYDLSSAYPGMPRIITEDADGRYRLYPAPYYKVSIKFDYIRQPQILSAYGDIPRGLDEDFVDLIMWRALIFYGEYDEQPSVVARATKNYKNLLSRLELKNRSKFRFQPRRLY
jgi:hypothetical protein